MSNKLSTQLIWKCCHESLIATGTAPVFKFARCHGLRIHAGRHEVIGFYSIPQKVVKKFEIFVLLYVQSSSGCKAIVAHDEESRNGLYYSYVPSRMKHLTFNNCMRMTTLFQDFPLLGDG